MRQFWLLEKPPLLMKSYTKKELLASYLWPPLSSTQDASYSLEL